LFAELRSQGTNYFFNIPKKSLLKSPYQKKKYLPNFRIQENPGIEHFKAKKKPLIIPAS